MSDPAEYQEKAISSAAGARYFRETGGGDPYAAGLAYPVFLALLDAYPHELGSTMAEFREKFGFYSNPASAKDAFAIPLGFHLTTDPNTTVPWLVGNCQMCHAERLRLDTGDVIVEGLGNHRVRVHAYSLALARIGADSALDPYRIEQLAIARAEQQHLSFPVDTRTAIARAALEGLTQASSRKMPLLTHLSTGLPGRMATIKSFAMSLGMQPHADVAYGKAIGWAKVPDVLGIRCRLMPPR